jgi:hypothetical protein
MRATLARLALTLALMATAAPGASARDWWDTAFGWLHHRCKDGYTCYGPPYNNTEPPDHYVYDHRVGPTWTGNGWAYLPVGRYRPRPPQYVEPPPPPPPPYRDDDIGDDDETGPRPMK